MVAFGTVMVVSALWTVVVDVADACTVMGSMAVLRYELQYLDADGNTVANPFRHGPMTQGPYAFRHESR